ncbi:acyl-CoA dehydrogenase [Polymorphobacter arshaanensis]|uniref:Acyl-CoA dehydrogenase n=2 Tax=Glacieibacterium arshaanense TaxID=2511025 RepID=A0A4Y9EQF9_9SPHN|nr:acyl-CoA dehydrogenase [Polymorphobacter arshaanensis]
MQAATNWPDWADEMSGRLAARARDAEAHRSVPQASIDEAAAAGFFAMAVPVSGGGGGASLGQLFDVTRRLAHGCASSAWTLSFLAMHAWLLCKFEPALQAELFAEGKVPMVPAPLAPTGQARKVDGGYRIGGRWEWATGVNHADWVMVNCIEPGAMGPRFCVLPIADVTVDDIWHTAGMAATGSNTIVASDVFVPDHRTMAAVYLKFGVAPGDALHPNSNVGFPMSAALALVAASPALGAAEGALDSFTARMKSKIQAYTGGAKQSDAQATHLRLGEALATVRAARLVWADAIALLEREGHKGNSIGVETLAAIRLASADVVRMANLAINTMAAAAGASSGFLDSPLQRHLRDVQMMRGHVVFDWDRAAQIGGKITLGLDPTPADLL